MLGPIPFFAASIRGEERSLTIVGTKFTSSIVEDESVEARGTLSTGSIILSAEIRDGNTYSGSIEDPVS